MEEILQIEKNNQEEKARKSLLKYYLENKDENYIYYENLGKNVVATVKERQNAEQIKKSKEKSIIIDEQKRIANKKCRRTSSQNRQETSESNVRRSKRIKVIQTLRANCIEYDASGLIEDDALITESIHNKSYAIYKLIGSLSPEQVSENIDNTESDLLQNILKIFDLNSGKEFFKRYLVEIINNWHGIKNPASPHYFRIFAHYIALSLDYIIDKQMVGILKVKCSFKQLKCLLNKTEKKSAIKPRHTVNWPHISMRIDLPGFRLIRTNNNYNEFTIGKDFKCDIVPLNTALRSESKLALSLPTQSIIKLLKHLQHFIVDSSLTPSQKFKLIQVLMEFEECVKMCGIIIEAHTEYNMHLNDYAYMRTIDEQKLKSDTIYLYEYCCPQISFFLEEFEAIYSGLNNQWLVEHLTDFVLCNCKLCHEELGSILSDNLYEHLSKYHGFENDWNCVKCRQTFSTDCLSNMKWKHICSDNFVQSC